MAWDKDEPSNKPLREVDDAIRTNNAALETALSKDHDFSTSGTQTGEHKQITFSAPISTPSTETDKGKMYLKDVGSKAELHFLDEDGHEMQMSSLGKPAGTIRKIASFTIPNQSDPYTVTGVGFTPKAVIILGSSTTGGSLGFDDGSTFLCFYNYSSGSIWASAASCSVIGVGSPSSIYSGWKVSSWNSDGCVLSRSVTGGGGAAVTCVALFLG